MANTATEENTGVAPFWVRVNNVRVYATSDPARVTAIVARLNAIFSDTNRDLDFITPSITSDGYYVITCPLVRKNVGEVTYLYDTNSSDGWRSYPEKLYEATHWNDSRDKNQTAILTIEGVSNPWVQALLVANSIRAAINLNFPDAAGRSTPQQLVKPSNEQSYVASTISSSATCDFYALPCQGGSAGTTSPCSEIGYSAQNILNTTTGNGEVLHGQGLTAAITSTNNWNTNYLNKFVKVTNLSTGQYVVVRVTDTAPAGRGIELTYRAWAHIGKPSGTGTVKIELMA
ncbi:septal ring lytic transglycosylase RlpA family protein [Paenibacillus sp. GCM10027628]|uniref:septal ring lytic transglycosylase RlpA family protein n=1 Tax=Paenibacillus sp. GCM10027628 TaxID=3273413 RepID=UPI0036447AEA